MPLATADVIADLGGAVSEGQWILTAASDWRLVFMINVPLAIVTILLTLSATPNPGAAGAARRMDYPGVVTFGLGIATLVFGLSQGQSDGWGAPITVLLLLAAVALLAAFVMVELRVNQPLLEFRLFRHINFLAANISQILAGAIELGLGFLMPFYLLLVIGVSPAVAGIALIPATIPIILAGPMAGRAFDRVGGRVPLVTGFLILAASGLALAAAVGEQSVPLLMPGLLLQGLACYVLVRRGDRLRERPVFGRRSRWVYATAGSSPAVTREPGDVGIRSRERSP